MSERWKEILKEWKLDMYCDNMEQNGFDFIDIWDTLTEHELINDLKFKMGHARYFIKKVKQLKRNNNSNDDSKRDDDVLYQWCLKNGFEIYYDKLINVDITDPKEFNLLSNDDINKLCDNVGIKFGKKAKFIGLINRQKGILNKNVSDWDSRNVEIWLNSLGNKYTKYINIIVNENCLDGNDLLGLNYDDWCDIESNKVLRTALLKKFKAVAGESYVIPNETDNNDDAKTNSNENIVDLKEDNIVIPSVQEERKLMKEVGYKMQVAGDTWYPISKKWYDIWKDYTCLDTCDDDVPGGVDNLHTRGIPRPGKIDNTELQGINICVYDRLSLNRIQYI